MTLPCFTDGSAVPIPRNFGQLILSLRMPGLLGLFVIAMLYFCSRASDFLLELPLIRRRLTGSQKSHPKLFSRMRWVAILLGSAMGASIVFIVTDPILYNSLWD